MRMLILEAMVTASRLAFGARFGTRIDAPHSVMVHSVLLVVIAGVSHLLYAWVEGPARRLIRARARPPTNLSMRMTG